MRTRWLLQIALMLIGTQSASSINSADDYRVTGLDKFGAMDEMYAGMMPLAWENKNTEGSLFFWLVKQRRSSKQTFPPTTNGDKQGIRDNNKLVIWLNGGPGCSSLLGMTMENGPFTLEATDAFHDGGVEGAHKYRLNYNPSSWSEVANVLYVEQPIRTGFSTAAEGAQAIRDESQVAADFRDFVLSFLQVFPEFKDVEIFISGESYAGFYIPRIAQHIVQKQLIPIEGNGDDHDLSNMKSRGRRVHRGATNANKDTFSRSTRDTTRDHINLQGVAIGNGVMDMLIQEPSYAEYAYYHGLIPLGAKQRIDKEWQLCLQDIERQQDKPLTRGSFTKCNMMTRVMEAAGNPNEYNTATFVSYAAILSPEGVFRTFYNDPEVQEALHVRGYNVPGLNFAPEKPSDEEGGPDTGTTTSLQPSSSAEVDKGEQFQDKYNPEYFAPPHGWLACNDAINEVMVADHPISVVSNLQYLISSSLDQPLRVLLYSGEFDLNCNTLGTLHTLEANYWRDGRPWATAERSLWRHAGGEEVSGEYFTMDDGIFSFLIVRNSGHLMPMDRPSAALDMITRFMNNTSFADTPLPSEQSYIEQMLLPAAGMTSMASSSGSSSSSSSSSSSYQGYRDSATQGWALLVLALLTMLIGVGCLQYYGGDFPYAHRTIDTARGNKSAHKQSQQRDELGQDSTEVTPLSRDCHYI